MPNAKDKHNITNHRILRNNQENIMYKHTTSQGISMLLKDMGDSHLYFTIKLLKRKAEDGLLVMDGDGTTAEEMWFDSYTLYGKDAEEALHLPEYEKEFVRRFAKTFDEVARRENA